VQEQIALVLVPPIVRAAVLLAATRFAVPEQIALVVAPPIVQAAVLLAAIRSVRDAVPAGNRFAVWNFHLAVRAVRYAAEFCLHPVASE
jgi:hypothetical protein